MHRDPRHELPHGIARPARLAPPSTSIRRRAVSPTARAGRLLRKRLDGVGLRSLSEDFRKPGAPRSSVPLARGATCRTGPGFRRRGRAELSRRPRRRSSSRCRRCRRRSGGIVCSPIALATPSARRSCSPRRVFGHPRRPRAPVSTPPRLRRTRSIRSSIRPASISAWSKRFASVEPLGRLSARGETEAPEDLNPDPRNPPALREPGRTDPVAQRLHCRSSRGSREAAESFGAPRRPGMRRETFDE